MNGQHGIEKISQSDAVRFRYQTEKTSVAVKTPRPTLFDDFKPRLIVAVKQLVSDSTAGIFVSQFERLGTEPLDVNNRDEGVEAECLGWMR